MNLPEGREGAALPPCPAHPACSAATHHPISYPAPHTPPQVESLQKLLSIARREANAANAQLEVAQAQCGVLGVMLAAVQAQCGEAAKARAAAEAEAGELRGAADELRASLAATSAQARALGRVCGMQAAGACV